MPVRAARSSDLPRISSICAAAFHEESLHVVLLPYRNRYPKDYLRAWHHHVLEFWWDYKNKLMVSYEIEEDKEVLKGVAIWIRHGDGWESLWGIKGWWDPRLLILPIIHRYQSLHRWLFPNRASVQPTPSNPNPTTYWNWLPATLPLISHLFNPPYPNYPPRAPTTSEIKSVDLDTSTPLLQKEAHSSPPFWELGVLATLPASQGRGHGRTLTRWGLGVARRQGLPAVVIAAECKEQFYQRCGFTELVGWATEGEGNVVRALGVRGGAVLWTKWPWEEVDEVEEGEREAGVVEVE